MEIKELLQEGIRQLEVTVEPAVCRRLKDYLELLEKFSFLGLTGYKTPEELAQFLILESLPILRLIPSGKSRLLDIGSGGGVPGLVLKIARPDLSVTLLEATKKKAAFLETVKTRMNLERLEIIAERAETAAKEAAYRENFDLVTARALAALPTLLEYAFPFLKTGGRLLALKGEKFREEIDSAQKAMKILKAEIREIHGYRLPFSGVEGKIVEIVKTAPTPQRFPRQVGMARKNPL